MLNFARLLSLGVTACLFFSTTAFGCTVPPTGTYVDHDTAIDQAKFIAVVEALRRYPAADGEPGGFEVEVIEYVKGRGPERFRIPNATTEGARNDSRSSAEGNYFSHQDTSFWTGRGRSGVHPDCEIHPAMLFAGFRYLVFGPNPISLGFENISADQDDLWLNYVRERVAGSSPSKPLPSSLREYVENVASIVVFTHRFDGQQVVVEQEILKGQRYDYARLLSPAYSQSQATALIPACSATGASASEVYEIVFFERLPTEPIRAFDNLGCVGGFQGPDSNEENPATPSSHGIASLRLRGLLSRNGARRLVFRSTPPNYFRPQRLPWDPDGTVDFLSLKQEIIRAQSEVN